MYIYNFSVHVLNFSNKYKLVPRAADGYKMYDISFKLLAYYFEKRRLWDPDQWMCYGPCVYNNIKLYTIQLYSTWLPSKTNNWRLKVSKSKLHKQKSDEKKTFWNDTTKWNHYFANSSIILQSSHMQDITQLCMYASFSMSHLYTYNKAVDVKLYIGCLWGLWWNWWLEWCWGWYWRKW